MKLKIVKVGNSKGLRLPKQVLEEYQISDQVELKMCEGHIEIRALEQPRSGWKEDFAKMVMDENEEPLIPDVFEDEDL